MIWRISWRKFNGQVGYAFVSANTPWAAIAETSSKYKLNEQKTYFTPIEVDG